MVSEERILEIRDKIVREFHPDKIILFGSYAEGTQREGSDVDLLVIMPFEGPSIRFGADMYVKLSPRFALDLLVRTPEQVKKRIDLEDFFFIEILKKGKTIYERVD
jgi:predicted nucleotidyltransferase